MPKIAQLVESRLRTWFEERCVAPRMQQIVVPSLWPRMKNVVEGDGKVAKVDGAPPLGGLAPVWEGDGRDETRMEAEEDVGRIQADREREGLRRRGVDRAARDRRSYDFDMPGGMPGMIVS